MKKYIVSIEQQDSPRLQSFLNQDFIQSIENEFQMIGFNAYQQSAKDYFQQAVVGRVQPLTLGEWGCTKSHLMCMEDFLASDEKYALVFEDDAIQKFEFDVDKLLLEIEQLNLTAPFVLSLGGVQTKFCRKVRGNLLNQSIFNRPVLKIHPYFYAKINHTYSYVIDREMAKLLLDLRKVKMEVADYFIDFMDKNAHYYMTYIFDHPEISVEQSHLERERMMMKASATKIKLPLNPFKYQFLRYTLDRYPYDK